MLEPFRKRPQEALAPLLQQIWSWRFSFQISRSSETEQVQAAWALRMKISLRKQVPGSVARQWPYVFFGPPKRIWLNMMYGDWHLNRWPNSVKHRKSGLFENRRCFPLKRWTICHKINSLSLETWFCTTEGSEGFVPWPISGRRSSCFFPRRGRSSFSMIYTGCLGLTPPWIWNINPGF